MNFIVQDFFQQWLMALRHARLLDTGPALSLMSDMMRSLGMSRFDFERVRAGTQGEQRSLCVLLLCCQHLVALVERTQGDTLTRMHVVFVVSEYLARVASREQPSFSSRRMKQLEAEAWTHATQEPEP